MPRFLDLTGQRFGRLTVIGVSRKVKSGNRERYYWSCRCDCGNFKEVRTDCLTQGLVKSCGCMKLEQDKINLEKNHRHKMSRTRLWHTYYGMKSRCEKPTNKRYQDYGARGITICPEWSDSFDAFAEWALSNGYGNDKQIDRIDNNGNYEPNNCRWVSVKENCRNRRSNVLIECEGEMITLTEFAEKNGMPYKTAYARYRKLCVKRSEL